MFCLQIIKFVPYSSSEGKTLESEDVRWSSELDENSVWRLKDPVWIHQGVWVCAGRSLHLTKRQMSSDLCRALTRQPGQDEENDQTHTGAVHESTLRKRNWPDSQSLTQMMCRFWKVQELDGFLKTLDWKSHLFMLKLKRWNIKMKKAFILFLFYK